MTPGKNKIRLDQLLVTQGHFSSREKAAKSVLAGWIRINGQIASKPGHKVPPDAKIDIKQRPPFVSRGGEKLIHALNTFPVSCRNKICVDLGASTGGFTDCLLKNGASKVYAVDVGYGQLDLSLREHPQVTVMEKTNARYLTGKDFPDPVDLLTADLSFISLTKVIPAIYSILKPGGETIVLVKPQFEAKKTEIQKGGVVKDPEIRERIIAEIKQAFANNDFLVKAVTESPLLGPAGNVEFLLWAIKRGHSPKTAE